MDPVVGGWDLVGIIAACIAVGAFGGLAYDLTEPVVRRRPRTGDAVSGADEGFGDNRLVLPQLRKVGPRRVLEAGLLGPVSVGAAAAIAAVFAFGVVRPDAPPQIDRQAVLRELQARAVEPSTVVAVERVLTRGRDSYVPWEKLLLIGIVAGFGGAAVVRGLRSRLISAIGGVAFDARIAGVHEGAGLTRTVVTDKAGDDSVKDVPPEAATPLVSAIDEAVDAHIDKLATQSAYGNPSFD